MRFLMPAATVRASAVLCALLIATVVPADAASPVVMLTLSKDENYFHKAYDDYSDLDGDGVVERGYDDRFDYDGYFHPHLCYAYSDANQRFEPSGRTDPSAQRHYCLDTQSDKFSGNFLNWATMTRMDLVRRALYGGKRSVDSATLTILERAHLPSDGHSFAKYYNGADLGALTPFDLQVTDTTNGGNSNGYDDALEGITLCNVSFDKSVAFSHTTSVPPLLRIAQGERRLWANNERWQCTWETEHGDNTNYNNAVQSGLSAASSDPPASFQLLTAGGAADRVVRVVACDPDWHDVNDNLEHCRLYPTGNRKPVGVLQEYGEDGALQFGLVSGSWAKNLSGGVVRKNGGLIADELASTSDGHFLPAPATGGIIAFFDTLRVWGYQYSDGTYFPNADNCGFQLSTITEGFCRAWGNPLAEMYMETLRYLSRETVPLFAANDLPSFANLPSVNWQNPVQTDDPPSSLNIVILNGAPPSYDRDQSTAALFDGIASDTLTNQVGDSEGLSGRNFLVGRTGAEQDKYCTSKTVAQLGNTFGPCPDSPTRQGSYRLAGLAAHAHGHDLHPGVPGQQHVETFSVELPPLMPHVRVPVDGVREHDIEITPSFRLLTSQTGGALVNFVVVRGHTEIDSSDRSSPGLPNETPDGVADIAAGVPTVNFPRPLAHTGIYHAKYYLALEDSEQGGDYDPDLWGTLDYVLDTTGTPAQLTITTKATAEGTGGGQLLGFVITGTSQDGFHAYSGIEGANFTDPSGVRGCNDCRALSEGSRPGAQNGPQSYTFTVAPGAGIRPLPAAQALAAKWGGFVDDNGNGVPDKNTEWDKLFADGRYDPSGSGADGIPDNYFELSNLALLRARLATIMARIKLPASFTDGDGDGIVDSADNCPRFDNPDQRDSNGDNHGNACDADLNNDGIVNAFDLAGFKRAFGSSNSDADFNGDGIVNARDLARFKALFGTRF